MKISICITIGIVFALAAVIALYITVMPKKKDGKFDKGILQWLHNYFHFKTLYIEAILKFVFALVTFLCIFVGFFMLFGKIDTWFGTKSTFFYGLLLMIGGPVISRLIYEFMMLTILLVQNVIEINRKLKTEETAAENGHTPEPEYIFCSQCGTRYDLSGGRQCPNCGHNN